MSSLFGKHIASWKKIIILRTMLIPYLETFFLACAPILELRFSIPFAYGVLGLSIYESVIISVIAIILTTVVVAYFLPKIVIIIEKNWPFFDRIMKKILSKTQSKHSHRMEIAGDVALIAFVAIPIPGSGAWTGVLIAYLFGIPYKKTLWLVSSGIILSGIIVGILTLIGFGVWDTFTEHVLSEIL